jgi:hypothetical protein
MLRAGEKPAEGRSNDEHWPGRSDPPSTISKTWLQFTRPLPELTRTAGSSAKKLPLSQSAAGGWGGGHEQYQKGVNNF